MGTAVSFIKRGPGKVSREPRCVEGGYAATDPEHNVCFGSPEDDETPAKMSHSKLCSLLTANKEFAKYPVNFSARTWTPEQLDNFTISLPSNEWIETLVSVYCRWVWPSSGVHMAWRHRLTRSRFEAGGVEQLAAALQDNKSVTKLSCVVSVLLPARAVLIHVSCSSLGSCEVNDAGVKALAQAVKKNKTLRTLK